MLPQCSRIQQNGLAALRAVVAACQPDWASRVAAAGINTTTTSSTSSSCSRDGVAVGVAVAAAAALGVAGSSVALADSQADIGTDPAGAAATSWFTRLTTFTAAAAAAAAPKAVAEAAAPQQPSAASSTAAWQQQQQQQWTYPAGGGGGADDEPLSGALPLLTDDGLTNHPLDYNPITNEHTAAMTMAKQAGVEAYEAGRYADAERHFKQAVSEARLGFPPGDPHISSALHYLAELYRNTRRFDEAEPLYQEALALLSDSLGERCWLYAGALCSLAALKEDMGDFSQARQLLEQALELRRQLFSANSYLYADTASLLAALLMKQAAAAAQQAGDSSSSSSSSSRGGGRRWFGRGSKGGADAVPADVLRAMQLYEAAIQIVVEAGGPLDQTPVVSWLGHLAAAQRTAGQPAAAVQSLQQALTYMALPPSHQDGDNSSSSSSSATAAAPPPPPEAGDGSSGPAAAAAAVSDTDAAALRRRLAAQASETAERLVDAQLAAGDLPGARLTMRAALEARMALFGRHLVVAKSLTRMSRLLLQEPPDPEAQQLAAHFASNAVAIAESALQGAQRSQLWWGVFRGALRAVTQTGYRVQLEAERASNRLMAALQLGNACLALADAHRAAGRLPEAEAMLRQGVGQLRWVLGSGQEDLQRISAVPERLEGPMLERVAGLLVDLKLLQMDCLEALADAIRAATAVADGAQAAGQGKAAAVAAAVPAASTSAGASGGGEGEYDDPDEVRMLLGEAELLAAELYGD